MRSLLSERLEALRPVELHHFGAGAAAGVNLTLRLPCERMELAPVLVAAHCEGPLGSPGADDNGSSVVALLELALEQLINPAAAPTGDRPV